ncbi:MAG: hypothetical protein CSYNP_04180 [Syntrophus sp. SKADARSKE-3]|nr:hypothetical protein [Syntrophus sp. SKADARSKE-3]
MDQYSECLRDVIKMYTRPAGGSRRLLKPVVSGAEERI